MLSPASLRHGIYAQVHLASQSRNSALRGAELYFFDMLIWQLDRANERFAFVHAMAIGPSSDQ